MTSMTTMANEVVSRADAKARGQYRYFTGKPCKRGLVSERATSNGQCFCRLCVSASRENALRWAKENPDKKSRINARWASDNQPALSAYKKRHYFENLDSYRAKHKLWGFENKSAKRSLEHKRRALKLKAFPAWYGELDDFALREAYDLCRRRESATGREWHIDHMIPLQARTACGLHCASNLQVIPASMNTSKKNKMQLTEPGEWLR